MSRKGTDFLDTEQKSTTIIGIVADDGIVMATDRQVSAHQKRSVQKIFKIHPKCVLTTSGILAHCQDVGIESRQQIKEHELKRGRHMSVDNATKKVKKINRGKLCISLLGVYSEDKRCIVMTGPHGSIIRTNQFDASGSGGQIAKGSIDDKYHSDITVEKAIEVSVDALESCHNHGVYTGEAIDIATIDGQGINIKTNYKSL